MKRNTAEKDGDMIVGKIDKQAVNSVKKIAEIMEVWNYNYSSENSYPEFVVESYQRGYRWNRDRAKQLLDDIYNNYRKYYSRIKEKEINDEDLGICGYEYCVQPLVVKRVGDREHMLKNGEKIICPVYNVIDGQQRLTTLYLIFGALNNTPGAEEIIRDRENNVHITFKRKDNASFDINKLIEGNTSELSIDDMYAKEVYDFVKDYINDTVLKNTEKYYAFTGKESNLNKNYTIDRLTRFMHMIQYFTTIIWYEPKDSEEDAFDVFNDKKIPLTGSELVKALFMNPDNYIEPGSNLQSLNELIKTRQIVIGNEWDRMEQLLHDEDFWHFFPHNDGIHMTSRMDAVIDFFVYRKLSNHSDLSHEEIKNSYLNDEKYAYKEMERLLLEELKNSEDKFKTMDQWWKEIRDLFDTYWSVFSPYREKGESGGYKVFHRISVLQYMGKYRYRYIDRKSDKENYINQLSDNKEWIPIMNENDTDTQIKELNSLLVDKINNVWKNDISQVFSYELVDDNKTINKTIDKARCDSLNKKIRALAYLANGKDSQNLLMRTFLAIHSLYELEKNVSTASRFSFREFEDTSDDKKSWVFEHIFAKGTKITDEEERKKIVENIANCGWEEYIRFKYEDILDEEVIEKILDTKKYYIDTCFAVYDTLQEDDREKIWGNDSGYSADTTTPEKENQFISFFKDNSMGNMGLIRKGDNSSVGSDIFKKKKEKIMSNLAAGSFVPSGTYSMFTGAYCEDFDSSIWYPCHRKKYLKNLIKGVEEYLNVK